MEVLTVNNRNQIPRLNFEGVEMLHWHLHSNEKIVLPSSLKVLSCTKDVSFPSTLKLPSLEELHIPATTVLECKLPKTLKVLIVSSLTEILTPLPTGLIDLHANSLLKLPEKLPSKLQTLVIPCIPSISKPFPKSLKSLTCSQTLSQYIQTHGLNSGYTITVR
jgi:hypothetical protein